MPVTRTLLNGLALSVANFAALVVGFVLYKASGARDQIAFQVPVAAILSAVFFLAWCGLLRTRLFRRHSLQTTKQFIATYVSALAWAPVIFVPVHFATQGYLTSFGNITAPWKFQVPVNLMVLLVASQLRPTSAFSRREASD
jgi:hypothetical protein